MSNKKVILRQVGKFVNVFDEDAVIISYLLNYKLVNDKVGFPMNALNKVINTLEEKKISYEVKGEEKIAKDFKNNNKYDSILRTAKEIVALRKRYIDIKTYFDSLTVEQLEKIISYIEEVINE